MEREVEKFFSEKVVYSSTDTVSKDKVISVRVEEALYNLLEAQTESWKAKSVSNTVRTILSMYFLPVIYEFEWKNRKPEEFAQFTKEQKEQGFSLSLSRYSRFIYEMLGYISFLEEAEERGAVSMEYIQERKKRAFFLFLRS